MNLLIRADASTTIGEGHLVRCLSLAYAWRVSGGAVRFLTYCESESLRGAIASAGFEVTTLDHFYPHPADLQAVAHARPERWWAAVDGYHFDFEYQQALRSLGYRVLCVEDTVRLPKYDADAILDQNVYAERLLFPCNERTLLLLGTTYALIRPEFMAWQQRKEPVQMPASNVLVTMGAGDPHNVTLKVVRALQKTKIERLEVRVVVGTRNPHRAKLQAAIGETNNFKMTLLSRVENMAELMAWAGIAVSAGGSTSWELCFMGVPSVFVYFADNQRMIAQGVDEAGAGLNLGFFNEVPIEAVTRSISELLKDPKRRRQMSERGRALVDGRGAERVVHALA